MKGRACEDIAMTTQPTISVGWLIAAVTVVVTLFNGIALVLGPAL